MRSVNMVHATPRDYLTRPDTASQKRGYKDDQIAELIKVISQLDKIDM